MADIGPNTVLNRKRLQVHMSEMKLSMERMELRKMELMDELKKIDENVQASQAEIQKIQSQLNIL